jgi:predicted membrane metal-binding protein
LCHRVCADGGWQTPVVRAVIMAFVAIVGRALDRGHSPLNATALAAFVLLADRSGSN